LEALFVKPLILIQPQNHHAVVVDIVTGIEDCVIRHNSDYFILFLFYFIYFCIIFFILLILISYYDDHMNFIVQIIYNVVRRTLKTTKDDKVDKSRFYVTVDQASKVDKR
jgi:hypothetical protein